MQFTAPMDGTDALDRIVSGLTQPQRRLLVGSLIAGREDDRLVPVDGNEKTIKALSGGVQPLIVQVDARRFLTTLGIKVAQHLNRTGQWEMPKVAPGRPEFHDPFEIEL